MWWQVLLHIMLVVVLFPYVQTNECGSTQKLCPNRACIDIASPCPQVTCRTIPATCKDGSCQPKRRICEQKKCRAGLKACPDGTCVLSFQKCPATHCPEGLKPCNDGTCILTHMDCPGSEEDDCPKRCKDGRCINANAYCPEDMCPYWQNNKCEDGDCFSNAERCNGIADCADKSDEDDCDEYQNNSTATAEKLSTSDILTMLSKWPWWVYLIAVGLFILLCLIIALCCRYQRQQSRARRMRHAQRTRRQQQSSQPYSHEMPVVAGRRMTPVPTSASGTSTPTPGAAYQPVPTQPPFGPQQDAHNSPYNPAFALQPAFPQSHYTTPTGSAPPGAQGSGFTVEPTAPPMAAEAPPPYSEAIMNPTPTQPGIRTSPYLPSYETVQRGGPR